MISLSLKSSRFLLAAGGLALSACTASVDDVTDQTTEASKRGMEMYVDVTDTYRTIDPIATAPGADPEEMLQLSALYHGTHIFLDDKRSISGNINAGISARYVSGGPVPYRAGASAAVLVKCDDGPWKIDSWTDQLVTFGTDKEECDGHSVLGITWDRKECKGFDKKSHVLGITKQWQAGTDGGFKKTPIWCNFPQFAVAFWSATYDRVEDAPNHEKTVTERIVCNNRAACIEAFGNDERFDPSKGKVEVAF